MQRRSFLTSLAAVAAGISGGFATNARSAEPKRVVVIGGGYGGATAARYLKLWGGDVISVTMIESDPAFVSCPLSNLVLGGSRQMRDITVPYTRLARRGIDVVRDTALAIDPQRREVRLARGAPIRYDRLVLSPGIGFFFDRIPGLGRTEAQQKVLHAWKAGSQTAALRAQIEAMPNGGVFAISIPRAPYRCPPAPYERACQVAWYFKRAKPRSKVLVLDGNEEVQSKKALFTRAWAEDYRGIVEYRPDYVLIDVDAATLTAKFETAEDERVDVLNAIPPHGAAPIAHQAGVVTANDAWCEVDFLTFESVKVKNVHVLGDAIQPAAAMPKSGHMANQHAKVCAAAVVALLAGEAPNPAPVLNNTCYSFITDRDVVHICSVHQYDREKKTLLPVQGAGGLSPQMSEVEGRHAFNWARNIWADALA